MFWRLPVALAQVQAGNTSENLLHEIRQIVYSFYQAKELIQKYNTKWILHLWILKIVKHLNLILKEKWYICSFIKS